MFAGSVGAFGDNAQQFGLSLRNIATTVFTALSLVCFICAAEYGVADVFTPA